MKATHIVNQDRDRIYPIGGSFYPSPVYQGGSLMGVKLMMDARDLGTFDTAQEVVDEINALLSSDAQILLVGGYSNGGFADWSRAQ